MEELYKVIFLGMFVFGVVNIGLLGIDIIQRVYKRLFKR